MTKTKKLINAPEDIIPQLVSGMVAAHPDLLSVEGDSGRAIVAVDGPRDGKVGVVVGGGSGHEPAFAGYVGRGLADAAAVGNIFASPSPEQILDAARAVDCGAGILFLYGNYTGDVMNFTMAAEELEAAGTAVQQVQVADDIASAPVERRDERRGIAGDFFVFKIAGAAADLGEPLSRVAALAQKANLATFSMGVALGACSLPQTGKPNFEIGDDEMEIGMGLHGEPGIRREKLASADSVTDELMDTILGEMAPKPGDRVAVLVNGLGSTSQVELYIIFNRLKQILDAREITIHRAWVGEYATSLEMAGASITLIRLDDELTTLLDHPCRSVALTVGAVESGSTADVRSSRKTAASTNAPQASPSAPVALNESGLITPTIFRRMMQHAGDQIITERDWLSELDGVIGDGDHGVTMEIGWKAVQAALNNAPAEETIEGSCKRMAKAFLDAVGASSGPLYATAFLRAGAAVSDRRNLGPNALALWLAAALQGIRDRGRAEAGDKTMIDAWVPAVEAAQKAAASGSELAVLQAARDGAEAGMKATADLESRRGRSAKLGARSRGHIDPGAASTYVILRAMAAAMEQEAAAQ
ncbi:dihydroxyacetone kinase subunit DhaL [Paracoccus seriniphilus]|uniref:Homodimeric dihydroxyacetone kinase n=1 Tax=Paracoccus seriniphilus TaxID=184748 RepID=A0A239Q3I6_9RHOB|nr:dihydroxyacetone kinase subunit DhaL [Paracoccus seriniphilus]WCR15866.1 dihydroxyacetone kinase subunit DhaK [Paracoccus seriniphilus]SNT76507.1 homodimeric dihydroxyacetone kinase [Paracoccus seriniphilus]